MALARYNPRTREEAEATAFATEFVCPSDAALRQWTASPTATSASVAVAFGVERAVCRAQLAEGLAGWLLRGRSPLKTPRPFRPNSSQRDAINHRVGPALVDAGPGTGKTATLVARVAALVAEGVPPSAVLILTFSNEATEELRVRLSATLAADDDALDVTVSTIHGLGREFLHLHGDHLGIPPNAAILDDYAEIDLVVEALGHLPPGPIFEPRDPRRSAVDAARHINRLKQTADPEGAPWSAETFRAALETNSTASPQQHAFADLLDVYEALKSDRGALDFADLVALPTQILREREDIKQAYATKFRHVLVDEFQDVSETCALFLRELTADAPPWVVGDARQAIYRFLGAAPENVTQFGRLFGEPTRYSLAVNYRSSPGIVSVANDLAALGVGFPTVPSWTSVEAESGGEVSVAVAESDAAEVEGAVAHVLRLLDCGAAPHDIAVLARRNVDVERIVSALAQAGVRANAAGSLSPEGAAGDLAAILTLPERPRASVPRLAYALQRTGDPARLDEAVSMLLQAVGPDASFSAEMLDDAAPDVVFDVVRTAERLAVDARTADGFDALASFLFDGGTYLRDLLDTATSVDSGTSSPARHRLAEVVATLARAGAYRVLQKGQTPEVSRRRLAEHLRTTTTAADRVRFAEHLRRTLVESAPTAVSPRPAEGAVQAMTVHASKGLEFAHVVLIGQSAPQRTTTFPWLPPSFSSLVAQEEREQANALLFVGATRAKRSLVVSYATSASGAAKSQRRSPSALFEQWLPSQSPEVWPAPLPSPPVHTLALPWTPPPARSLGLRSLDASGCALRAATEDVLRLRFPQATRPFYPPFVGAVRLAISNVLDAAWETGSPVSASHASEILDAVWKDGIPDQHHHVTVYRELASRYVTRFAKTYEPQSGRYEPLPSTIAVPPLPNPVRLGLVRVFRRPDETAVALLFRPESYASQLRADGRIKWSGLAVSKRLPFVLLRTFFPDLVPLVYSGDDGVVYPFAWSDRAGSEDAQANKAYRRAQDLSTGAIEYKVSAWTCDRCAIRIGCPHHLQQRGRDYFQ